MVLRSPEDVNGVLVRARQELRRLEGRKPGTIGRVRIVLVGRANAGKSTLFNALAGAERALVHGTPGTTTDAVTVELALGDTLLTLVDTAGTGAAAGSIQAAAGEVRGAEVDRADLVLGVVDLSAGDPAGAEAELSARECPHVVAGTKIDLLPPAQVETYRHRFVPVSALTGAGMADLVGRLEEAVADQVDAGGELVSVRQHETVGHAADALERAAAEQARPELCALELRAAEEALSEILGEGSGPDLLESIFSRFCIGK